MTNNFFHNYVLIDKGLVKQRNIYSNNEREHSTEKKKESIRDKKC